MKSGRTYQKEFRVALLLILDVLMINVASVLALWVRFDFIYTKIPNEYWVNYKETAIVHTVFTILVFVCFKLYQSMWKYASIREASLIIYAVVVSVLTQWFTMALLKYSMPRSFYILQMLFGICSIIGVRFSYRMIRVYRLHKRHEKNQKGRKIMIVGAGQAGQMIIKEYITSDELESKVCCIIDDDQNKIGSRIMGIPIVGNRNTILENSKKYDIDKIVVALPKATNQQRKEILNICQITDCEIMMLPGLYQIINGEVSIAKLRNVEIEDLLGRDPIDVNLDEIMSYVCGKVILVTGGGGSIGSEIARQIAEHDPKALIIFDIYENNAYSIEQELKRKYKNLNLIVLIGSVRDSRRINWVFEKYKPDIVYHAAAHKHVPLMETSPNEAIKNNVIGTYKTAYAALKHGTQRFVLISTDKAVNPTNIMGASKRLCEMVIQSMDAISKAGCMDVLPLLHSHKGKRIDAQGVPDSIDRIVLENQEDDKSRIKIESIKNGSRKGTQFVAVRFGNVLGSNGSVIPLFKKQIEEGGPVTITHPDIVRYFMTIPEAVSLVLQAGTYAWGGEIFVLDMGEAVKIDTLARNLIKLSGYEPDVEIKLTYTGLRPGEKLFEERLMAEEGIKKTDNDLIYIGKPIPFDVGTFLKQLEVLARASYENSENIVQLVEEMVPTFHPAGNQPYGNNRKNLSPQSIAMKEAAATIAEN